MKREEGYYWVKYNGKWQVAEWYCEEWIFNGGSFFESFEDINENRIKAPNETNPT